MRVAAAALLAVLVVSTPAVAGDDASWYRAIVADGKGGFLIFDQSGTQVVAEVKADGEVDLHHEELRGVEGQPLHNEGWAIARIVKCAEGPVPGACRGGK